MQRADSATVFRGPDSPGLLAPQAMYQPAQRHQPFPGVPGSQWAEARQPVTQPGYWAGPQQAALGHAPSGREVYAEERCQRSDGDDGVQAAGRD